MASPTKTGSLQPEFDMSPYFAVSVFPLLGTVALHSTSAAVITIGCLDVGVGILFALVAFTLRRTPGWSLAGALSEDIIRSAPATPAIPAQLGAAGVHPPEARAGVQVPEQYDASASRLIAFFGMLVVMMVFVGFANFMIWQSFTSGQIPQNANQVMEFLGGGASLFLPYAANQFRAAVQAIAPNPKP